MIRNDKWSEAFWTRLVLLLSTLLSLPFGTAQAQPELVLDILEGSASGDPTDLTVFNDRLVFSAVTPGLGRELWISDGRAEGTRLLKDIYPGTPGSSPWRFTQVGDFLYFVADDGENGEELWRTDGTEEGTELIKDINPGSQGSNLSSLTALGSRLVFAADDGVNGKEIWSSDGTESGTIMLRDQALSGRAEFFAVFNDRVYFTYNGNGLWATDGTPAGTQVVTMVPDEVWGTENVGNFLLFSAADNFNGDELWRSDGTEAGTLIVKDLEVGTPGSFPDDFTRINDQLTLFAAFNSATGKELWRTDGTNMGTQLVKDINQGGGSGVFFQDAVVRNGKLYFAGTSFSEGQELWVSDGTEAGTRALGDIAEGGSDGLLDDFYMELVGDDIFVHMFTNQTGQELYLVDPDDNVTRVADLNVGPETGVRGQMVGLNNTLYFVGDNGTTGSELWRYRSAAANNAPDANNDSYVMTQGSSELTLAVLDNDEDIDGDRFFIVEVTEPDRGGSVRISDDEQALLYQPVTGFTGQERFDYTIEDEFGARSTATVTVNVNAVAVGGGDSGGGGGGLLYLLALITAGLYWTKTQKPAMEHNRCFKNGRRGALFKL